MVRIMGAAISQSPLSPIEEASTLAIPRAPPRPATLLDAIDWHSVHQPDRTHILLLHGDETAEPITFGDLRAEAAEVAAGLIRRGTSAGETVAIMLPTGREFFAAFYGALCARAIPVPLYPPARLSQIESHLRRAAEILVNCEARTLITFDRARRLAQLLGSLTARLECIVTVSELRQNQPVRDADDRQTLIPVAHRLVVPASTARSRFPTPPLEPSDTALLQYTSGSTAQPKGVVLTHGNIIANLSAMQRVTGVTHEDCFVSWLPLYHDMGLIGASLGALVIGFPLVLMAPSAFLSRPVRWLRAVARYRATITAAPNFAYEMCVRKIDAEDLGALDLSSLRCAFSGAEAVSPQTLDRFAVRFAAHGLRRSALTPVYGLAECALGLSFPPMGRGPTIDRIDRDLFRRKGIARKRDGGERVALSVVSCGRALPGYSIRIVDEAGSTVPERVQGRIEFQGPSATRGYHNSPADTARLFDGDWLDSGDLGYLAEGELYVTGRAKDIIIRAGHNIHPQELEEAIGRLPQVRKGGVVVFPSVDRRRATERAVALVETLGPQSAAARGELIARINRLAVDVIGMPIDEVVLVPPRTVLKTSSGKIRRAACRQAYERGTLNAAGRAPWLQLARLSLQSVRARCTRARRRVETFLGRQ
jgi:acyl-CoA synthetase (AMP-forming)/AMP-acid ligase II